MTTKENPQSPQNQDNTESFEKPSESAYDYFHRTLVKHFSETKLNILAEIEYDSDMSAIM